MDHDEKNGLRGFWAIKRRGCQCLISIRIIWYNFEGLAEREQTVTEIQRYGQNVPEIHLMPHALRNRRAQFAQVTLVKSRKLRVKAMPDICKHGNQSLGAFIGEAAVYVLLGHTGTGNE
ncbi:unnamed protein product [Protopolystoma xenopodis]|uniref:Uncharacterized protein n=1 Tax=Protopolystoma xenopodis TaxID=117903 RepID=A0A448WKF8_9PLAT|nr:unnamed protein product [Protopolystoma xenopodis]